MAFNGKSLDEYVDVAERIQDFMDAHPTGSLQRVEWEIRDVAGKTFVVYTAAAYRTADDPRPGIGTAWEPFPGGTPYTKNSELMNAETAAWGRAIVALGLCANRKLASRQEVRARQEEQAAEPVSAPVTKPKGNTRAKAAKPAAPAEPAKTEPSAPPAEPTLDEVMAVPVTGPAAVVASLDDDGPAWGSTLAEIKAAGQKAGLTREDVRWHLVAVGATQNEDIPAAMKSLTEAQAVELLAAFEKAAA